MKIASSIRRITRLPCGGLAKVSSVTLFMLVILAIPLRSTSAETLLSERPECVSFRWDPAPSEDANAPAAADAGISLPVSLNGRSMWLQLDTGTSNSIVYGDLAERMNWAQPKDKNFVARELIVGATYISGSHVAIMRDEPVEETAGELGFSDLRGMITVLDYPARRFCLFKKEAAPSEIMRKTVWASAKPQSRLLFVDVATSGFSSHNVIFDTGTGWAPLLVDLANWQRITRQQDPARAAWYLNGAAFSHKVMFRGAMSSGDLMIGHVSLGQQVIFTEPERPHRFGQIKIPVDGVIGNAALLKHRIVIDLTGPDARFGIQ